MAGSPWRARLGAFGRVVLTLAVVIGLWEAVRLAFGFDSVTMPSAFTIGKFFFSKNSQGQVMWSFLLDNMLVTARGAVLGLFLGVITGMAAGILIAQNRYIRSSLLP